MVGGGDDFFGHTKGCADFAAGEFAVLEELKVGTGEGGFDDVGCAPEQDGAVGRTGGAFAVFERGGDLGALFVGELMVGSDDEAVIGIIFDEAAHEGGSSEVGVRGVIGREQGRESAPGIERIGEAVVPDFFREKDLGFDGSAFCAVITPADDFVVVDDLGHGVGFEEEDAF